MKKILVVTAVLIGSLIPVAITPLATADTAVTCYDSNKNIDTYYVAESIGGDFNNRFRLHIDYNHCVSALKHYDVMKSFVYSVTMLGNANCNYVTKWRMNATPLNGHDSTERWWYCEDGRTSYSETEYLDYTVGGASDDRCLSFKWIADRPWYRGDFDGTSPTVCLG